MSVFLEWARIQPDLHSQPDWIKAEICLLNYILNYNSPIIGDLTFVEDLYQSLAHVFCPSEISLTISVVGEQLGIERKFIKQRVEEVPEDYGIYDTDNLLYGIHQVMFDTDFGTVSVSNPEYVTYLKEQSKIDRWGQGIGYQHIDLINECGIALKCLGSDLDQAEKDKLVHIENIETNWITYHAFLTYEIYQAL